jgi:KUP system potassium uptake protein
LLFFYVARHRWRIPVVLLALGAAFLLSVDLLFFTANLTKIAHGAWLPLLVGLVAFTVMTTWERGREIVTRERRRLEGSLRLFVEHLRNHEPSLVTVPGTAVFLNRGAESAPLAFRANVTHNHVRHEHVLIVSIDVEPVPRIPSRDQVVIDDLGYDDDGIYHVTIRTGYMERSDIPAVLRKLTPEMTGGRVELNHASYFLSKVELRPGSQRTMARWRKRLFLATAHLTADAAEHFNLPRHRTVVLGERIEV